MATTDNLPRKTKYLRFYSFWKFRTSGSITKDSNLLGASTTKELIASRIKSDLSLRGTTISTPLWKSSKS